MHHAEVVSGHFVHRVIRETLKLEPQVAVHQHARIDGHYDPGHFTFNTHGGRQLAYCLEGANRLSTRGEALDQIVPHLVSTPRRIRNGNFAFR